MIISYRKDIHISGIIFKQKKPATQLAFIYCINIIYNE